MIWQKLISSAGNNSYVVYPVHMDQSQSKYMKFLTTKQNNRVTFGISFWIKMDDANEFYPITSQTLEGPGHFTFDIFAGPSVPSGRGIGVFDQQSANISYGGFVNIVYSNHNGSYGGINDLTYFHHYFLQWGTTVNLYLDGVLVGVGSGGEQTMWDSIGNSPITICGWFQGAHASIAEVIITDGLYPQVTDLGQFVNGIWTPKQYVGLYGPVGSHLTFSDSSNLGKDSSGNNNDWTNYNNNLSITDRIPFILHP